MRVFVLVEAADQWDWLEAFDFVSHGIEPVALAFGGRDGLRGGLPVRWIGRSRGGGTALPDFAEILRALEEEKPAALFVSSSGPLAVLGRTAADLFGVPVFSLLSNADDLANASRHRKNRPDLFFIADSSLFPAALLDDRYGSTFLPTGHPAWDRALRLGTASESLTPGALGDGRAAERILAAFDRWRTESLAAVIPELSVIVPAYREARNLPLVCDRLLETLEKEPFAFEILLIDDASPDDTFAVATAQMWRSPHIRAFSKPTPRGMGNGIRYGLRVARAPYVAVTMGDGSDEVSRVPEMFRKVRDEGFSLAIGSRYRHRRNYEAVPMLYRFWSRCFRLATGLLVGVRLKDYTNAFRVFDRKIFSRYGIESGGFEISPEITFKAWFATRRIAEVDVRHLKRSSGQSSFSFLRAGPGYAKILFKAFINRLTGRWFTLDW